MLDRMIKKPRITAVVLAVCMMLPSMPVTSFGDVADKDIIVSDVCTHHTHNEDCGFVEADPGHACEHEHTEVCYAGEPTCGIEENEGVVASGSDAPHIHTKDCYELNCPHENDGHDEACGYVEEAVGAECIYECEQCKAEVSKMVPRLMSLNTEVTTAEDLVAALGGESVATASDATVTLLQSVILPATITIAGGEITLDLGGKSIIGKNSSHNTNTAGITPLTVTTGTLTVEGIGTISGGSGSGSDTGSDGRNGGHGIHVIGGNLIVSNSTIKGGDGGNSSSINRSGGDGGSGIHVTGGNLIISTGTIRGGAGGAGLKGSGGNGGNGVTGAVTITSDAVTFTGGDGGAGTGTNGKGIDGSITPGEGVSLVVEDSVDNNDFKLVTPAGNGTYTSTKQYVKMGEFTLEKLVDNLNDIQTGTARMEEDGKTVTLLRTVILPATITIAGGDITLDLGGKTIIGKSGAENGRKAGITPLTITAGTLTVEGIGTISGGSGSNNATGLNGSAGGHGIHVIGGDLIVSNSTIKGGDGGNSSSINRSGGDGGSGIHVTGGNLIISTGTIRGGAGGAGLSNGGGGGTGGNGVTGAVTITSDAVTFTGGDGGAGTGTNGTNGKGIDGSITPGEGVSLVVEDSVDNNDFKLVTPAGNGTYTSTKQYVKMGEFTPTQQLALAKTAIEAAMGNLAVSNATTEQDILAAANGATLHGVTVAWDSDHGFSKIEATSSGTGSITGTLKLTLNNESDTVSVNKTLAKLPLTDAEKIDLAKTAIEAAITNLDVSNETVAQDILTAANGATLHGVTVAWDSDHDFNKTEATSSGTGSITGTLKLTLNNDSATTAVDKTIAKLPLSDAEKVAAAKTAIEAAITNLDVSNETVAQDILTAASNATLHGVTVAWDSNHGFNKTEATSSGTGSITGTLRLTLNNESDTVSVNKTLAKLPLSDAEKVALVKAAIEAAMGNLAVSNATTEQDILATANGATLHSVTVAWDSDHGFNKIEATSNAPGSITGTLKLTLNNESDTVSVNKTLAMLPLSDAEKVAAAKTAIEAAITNLAVSNATTAQNILTTANDATLHSVTVAWDSNHGFSKIEATSSGTGSITGTLKLTLNNESDTVSVNKTLAKLPLTDAEKIDLAKTAIEAAITNLDVSNETVAQDILTAANGATLHGVTVAWDSDNGFNKTEATSSGTGSITGTLKLTLNNATATIVVSKVIPQLSITTYTVTLDANGGSVSPTSLSVAAGDTVTLPTPTRSGSYRFDGWFTAASGGTQYTDATPVNDNVTLYAHWTYTGGSSSGGGGSSGGGSGGSSGSSGGNVTVTSPAQNESNTPIESEVKLPGNVDASGNATATVTDQAVKDAIQKAEDVARQNGKLDHGITLVLRIDTGNPTANSVSVNLPKVTQETILNKQIVNTVLVVDNPDIKISMNLQTVTEINRQAKADVHITTTRIDGTKLTGAAKDVISNRPAFDLKATYQNGTKRITDFGGGTVSLAFPYTLQAGEVTGGLYAVYVDDNGAVSYLNNSSYDAANKVLRFSTNHFSVYGIGYKAPAGFTDIADHWARADIEFVAARGLIRETGNTTFSPNAPMTRATFVTALGRLAGIDSTKYQGTRFTDVAAEAYYAPYVMWATEKGIAFRTGATTFSPNQRVTRQEMAAFMANYSNAMNYKVSVTREAITFSDNSSIESWAVAAVKRMQMAGIINGKNGNLFDPQGAATRGEASAMLHRFIQLMLNTDAAQGWSMNDSGQWIHYQGGKLVDERHN